MICRIRGDVLEVSESAAVVEVGGVAYEVLVPALALAELAAARGRSVTLHTVQYFEGNLAVSHLTPRLIGFVDPLDRAFFNEFTKVKGISMRRALRAMNMPVAQLAAAIERGDQQLLTTLPEIGRKTAAQIIAELGGKLGAFVSTAGDGAGRRLPPELSSAQRIALDIIVGWGDRRADAERWVAAALEAEPALERPDAIVRAAYRVKAGG